jgi:hypothetical protein
MRVMREMETFASSEALLSHSMIGRCTVREHAGEGKRKATMCFVVLFTFGICVVWRYILLYVSRSARFVYSWPLRTSLFVALSLILFYLANVTAHALLSAQVAHYTLHRVSLAILCRRFCVIKSILFVEIKLQLGIMSTSFSIKPPP